MKQLAIRDLPGDALDASAAFQRDWLAKARGGSDDLLLVFAPAAHPHRQWRLAAVQELAREAAPRRVNAVSAPSAEAVQSALDYLADAPGVTGQYLRVA